MAYHVNNSVNSLKVKDFVGFNSVLMTVMALRRTSRNFSSDLLQLSSTCPLNEFLISLMTAKE